MKDFMEEHELCGTRYVIEDGKVSGEEKLNHLKSKKERIGKMNFGEMITITKKEYMELLEIKAEKNAFAKYACKQSYIDKETCAAFFGFEIENDEEENKNGEN